MGPLQADPAGPSEAVLATGLGNRGIPVAHFVLHADEHTLIRRIEADPVMPGSQWRLSHVKAYQQALPWLRSKGTVIETAGSRQTR